MECATLRESAKYCTSRSAVVTEWSIHHMRMFAQNPPKPASTFLPASSRPFPAPVSLKSSPPQAGGSHQPELAGPPAYPVTDVLQRVNGKGNKKQEKQKAAAAQAKRNKQSKADRNANAAA